MPRKQPQDPSNPELPGEVPPSEVSPVDAKIEDSVESTEQPKPQPVNVTKLEDGRTIEDF